MKKLIYLLGLTLLLLFTAAACGTTENENAVNDSSSAQQNNQAGDVHEAAPEDEQSGSSETGPPTGAEQEEGSGTGGFLWKASHQGNTVYMLGSIHVATEDFYPLHEKIEAAFAESDVLAVEADIVHVNAFELQKMMDELAAYQDGTTLADHLPAELYEALQNEFKQFGISLDMFSGYEPWYVQMLLENLQIMQQGYDATLGIDYHFLEQAGEQGMDIVELEGTQFQLEMFDQLSPEIQFMLIESTLQAEDQEQDDSMEQLVEYWKVGDEQGMAEILLESTDDSPEMEQYMNILLDERNVGMADKIEQFLTSDEPASYFVVVGAAHYIGDDSIISILKDRGYEIEKEIEQPE
ncbi:TraB/GumN family protein [Marinicrinis lubricantis]|uniref:TraB/GumN family protein n=1 Tax=Marinicrinis lubricantis TaxID=2086470 RepID=A0ABW1IRF0_9BACL